jgi:phosphopantetheinyl transferase
LRFGVIKRAFLALLAATFTRKKASLQCWIRKKTYTKARGKGCRWIMRKFEEIDGQTAPRLRIESNPDEAEPWTLVDLIAPENYWIEWIKLRLGTVPYYRLAHGLVIVRRPN